MISRQVRRHMAREARKVLTHQIRDRIRELRRVRARDLVPNSKNWHRHPKAQTDALRDLLEKVGYADTLPEDGRPMIIDGHLRREVTPDTEVPVLVFDVRATGQRVRR